MKLARLLFVFIILFVPVSLFACKEAILAETYPITDFSEYTDIVVVKIDSAVHSSKYMYNPLVSFKATVVEKIKGELVKGDSISGEPKREEAKAVCPVHFEINENYLLLLTKKRNVYKISRFSFPVKGDLKYFDDYIKQVKSSVKK